MPTDPLDSDAVTPDSGLLEIDAVCERFEREWSAGRTPRIEDFLGELPARRESLFKELLAVEVWWRRRRGEQPAASDYAERFPGDLAAIEAACAAPPVSATRPAETRVAAAPAGPSGTLWRASPFLAGSQLLFGVIALQNSFITREQLVSAFDAWVRDKSRPLPEILVSHGAISQPQHDLLQRLVELFLEKHHGDADLSLAALSSVAEVRSQLEQLGDADLSTSLGHVARDRSPEQDFASTLVTTGGNSRGRFRILRPHAQGGLGQVSVALDQELNREVALKEIQPRHADEPASRERFVLEAEITGGLEHPGIVPVYALGQTPDGRPFYAMRFVKGDSLKTAIEAYHRTDNPNRKDAGARQLELRQLLGRFIDVCNAMDYAHSRGVLHRDLKPGNIMIGKYGETLVVDWGLAKAVGRPEIHSDEASLRPTTALSSSGQTQPGSAVGTPAYMSPEQAAGELDRLGPTSDVYSLGATLYHLLCGQSPFKKDELADILAKVQRGDFPRPRSLAPEVSPALEAVCLKAMSLNPADRYPTPRALADDLEHWLADEPVTAHADSASTQVARWSRKHRGWVQAGAVAVVLLLIVTCTFAVLINEQRRQTAKLAREKTALADEKSRLADEKTRLADDKGRLAETNQKLFQSERDARTIAERNQKLADERAVSLKQTVARARFESGLREYADSRIANGYSDLMRALAMCAPDDPAIGSYRRVLADRASQAGKQLVAPLRHAEWVDCLAFSADGTRLVTGSGSIARLWDARTGRPMAEPMKHESFVSSVAFSPDGKQVVTGSFDKTARLWDAATARPVNEPLRHDQLVTGAAFTPDGARIVTASSDTTGRLWNATTGRPIGDAMPQDGRVTRIAVSPNGTRIVFLVDSTTLRMWDALTAQPVGKRMIHPDLVFDGTFSPDSQTFVTACRDKAARRWSAETALPVGEPMRHPDFVTAVAVSPDGAQILTGTEKALHPWNPRTGGRMGASWPHEGGVDRIIFSPDGSQVLTTGRDRAARLWDVTTGKPLSEPLWHDDRISDAAFSPDGMSVATCSNDKTARLWDATAIHRRGLAMKHTPGNWQGIVDLELSPNGTRVVTAGLDSIAQVWDVATGKPIGPPLRHARPLLCVAFSPDGKRVVTGGFENTARIWNGETGEPVGKPMPHQEAIDDIQFSPDGGRLLTCSRDHTARFWITESGEPLGQPLKHDSSVNQAVFSPDGRFVATVCFSSAYLWNTSSGQPHGAKMEHERGSIVCAAFSPDSRRLITGSLDKTARIWDVATGKQIGAPLWHADRVTDVEFSPDSRWVLTASFDKTARLWDASNQQPIGQPLRHGDLITRAAFSADGTLIVTASYDTTVQFWDAATGAAIGDSLRHDSAVGRFAFDRKSTRIMTSAGSVARAWETALPEFKDAPAAAIRQTLEVWTGLRSDGDGNVRPLDPNEIEQIRADLGERDVIAGTQSRRLPRAPKDFHRLAAAAAERDQNGFAAEFHLRRLQRLDPDDPIIPRRLDMAAGLHAARNGLDAEAAAAFGRVLEADPADVPARLLRAAAAEKLLDWQTAIGDYSRLLEADPQDDQVRQKRVESFLRLKRYEEAVSDLSTILERNPKDLGSWTRRALANMELKRWEQVIDDSGRAIELKPPNSYPYPWTYRAAAHANLQRWEAAAADYQKLTELTPWDWTVWKSLGNLQAILGRRKQAVQSFGMAIGPGRNLKTADFAQVFEWQATAFLAQGDVEAYTLTCKQSLTAFTSTEDPAVANTVAWTCVLNAKSVPDWEPVLALSRKAARNRSHHSLNTLGAALYRAGLHKESIDTLTEGISLHGSGGTVEDRLFLSMASFQLKQPEDALRWLEKAEKELPEPPKTPQADWAHHWQRTILLKEARAIVRPMNP